MSTSKYHGNMIYYIKNLNISDIEHLNLQENTQYYVTMKEFGVDRNYLMAEPLLVSIARLAQPEIIKKSLDKFIHEFSAELSMAKDEKEEYKIQSKYFLDDSTNSFSHVMGALFEQDSKVIKDVVAHFKTYDKNFILNHIIEKTDDEDGFDNEPFGYQSLDWLKNEENKIVKLKLELLLDFFDTFFNKQQMPLMYIHEGIKRSDKTLKNHFFNLIKNRQYEISSNFTSDLIMEGEEYTLASESTIRKAINDIIVYAFIQSSMGSYNTKNNKEEYKEYQHVAQFYDSYNHVEHNKKDIIFYLSYASLTTIVNNKLDKNYLEDLNSFLSTTKKSDLINSLKTYQKNQFFDENRLNLESIVIHFMTQLSTKTQKDLITDLPHYPNINKLFKPILQKHYSAIVLEDIGYTPDSEEEFTLATAHTVNLSSKQIKTELKNSRQFVEEILLSSLDLVSSIEKRLKNDGAIETSEQFNKMKVRLEKKIFEQSIAQAPSAKKIKI